MYSSIFKPYLFNKLINSSFLIKSFLTVISNKSSITVFFEFDPLRPLLNKSGFFALRSATTAIKGLNFSGFNIGDTSSSVPVAMSMPSSVTALLPYPTSPILPSLPKKLVVSPTATLLVVSSPATLASS